MKTIVIIGGILLIVLAVLFFTLNPTDTQAPEPVVPSISPETTNVPELISAEDESKVPDTTTAPETGRIANPTGDKGGEDLSVTPVGKIKADIFNGKLEEVNTGCFADGECYVTVAGKHVTTLMGWSRDVVGQILGVEGFGDLEGHIGETVEVYAQVNEDGTYTLYGSEGFYVKLK